MSPKLCTGLLLATFVAAGACGATEQDAEPPELSQQPAPEPAPVSRELPTGTVCAPIVHGCGCAYQCGLGSLRPDGSYDVVHDFQDSRIDISILERRCFDAAGRSHPAQGAPPEADNCLDVFYDQTTCGGECVPSTEFLDCILDDDRCQPR